MRWQPIAVRPAADALGPFLLHDCTRRQRSPATAREDDTALARRRFSLKLRPTKLVSKGSGGGGAADGWPRSSADAYPRYGALCTQRVRSASGRIASTALINLSMVTISGVNPCRTGLRSPCAARPCFRPARSPKSPEPPWRRDPHAR